MVLRDPLYICGSVDEGRCENNGDYLCYHVSHLCGGAILPDIVKWCDRWLSGLPGFFKADREEISPVALNCAMD